MILECLRYNFEKVQKQKLNLRKKKMLWNKQNSE